MIRYLLLLSGTNRKESPWSWHRTRTYSTKPSVVCPRHILRCRLPKTHPQVPTMVVCTYMTWGIPTWGTSGEWPWPRHRTVHPGVWQAWMGHPLTSRHCQTPRWKSGCRGRWQREHQEAVSHHEPFSTCSAFPRHPKQQCRCQTLAQTAHTHPQQG